MPPKIRRPLKSTANELVPKQAPSNFLSNLCQFHITQSDLRDFSHNFVNKLLIPELLKCTKLPASNKLVKKPLDRTKLIKKPSDRTIVPGYRVSQCIDISSMLPANSRRLSKVEQVARAVPLNNKKPETRAARPKTAPSKSSRAVRTSRANEKTKLTKQKSDEVLPVAKIGAIDESTLARAIDVRNGDLVISEIIIKFCRNDYD